MIRAWILTGELLAKRIYTAQELAARLEVSATPIREALFDLANEGLVEPMKNRGFRLIDVTDGDLDEIFVLRSMLEIPAIASVAAAGSIDAAEFRSLVAEIQRHARLGNVPAFLEFDRQFHLGLLKANGNRRLCEMVARLRDQTRLFRIPHLAQSGALSESADEHVELLDAILDHHVDRAAEIMTRHLEHTRGIWALPSSESPHSFEMSRSG